jgi:hypothetical protein
VRDNLARTHVLAVDREPAARTMARPRASWRTVLGVVLASLLAPSPLRLAVVAPMALAVGLAGCSLTSEVSAVPQDRMEASVLSEEEVERLGLAEAGDGTVAWWRRDGDPAPGGTMRAVSSFDRTHPLAATEVFPGDVATLPEDATARTLAIRPAWTSRVDNTSETVNRSAFADEVTLDFLHPESPGQHESGDDAPVLPIDAEVEVPAGSCIDLVSLHVWELGPPQIEHQPGDVQADFLGTVLAEMPCA